MSRLLLALPLAVLLIAAPALAEPASVHVAAARKAAKSNNWNKALEEWKLAYRIEPNSDYLIGMGDAYAKMGDKANARKQYNAYLADPLSLDADSVKGKLAALDKPAGADDLSLDLTGPTPPPAKKAVASNDLDLLSPDDVKGKKAPPKKDGRAVAASDLSLDLSMPAPAPPAAKPPPKPVASNSDLSLDITGPTPPPKPAPKPVASNSDLSLDITGPTPPPKPAPKPVASNSDLSLDIGPLPAKPAATASLTPPPSGPAKPGATGTTPPPGSSTAGKLAVATTPSKPSTVAPPAATHNAPPESVATVRTEPRVAEHSNRIVAYATAGLAVGALAVGGVYISKSSSDTSDANAHARSGQQAQGFLDTAKKDKSIGVGAIIAGVALGAVATAVFIF